MSPRPCDCNNRIQWRVAEAKIIERMPFFKEDQTKLTPEGIKFKELWLQIINERIAKLPRVKERGNGEGRTQQNSRAARGEEMSEGSHTYESKEGGRYPDYMKEADERSLKDES